MVTQRQLSILYEILVFIFFLAILSSVSQNANLKGGAYKYKYKTCMLKEHETCKLSKYPFNLNSASLGAYLSFYYGVFQSLDITFLGSIPSSGSKVGSSG